jgi:hypothetical protein
VDVLAALIPPVAMAATFIAIAVTAYRATDGASRQERLRDPDAASHHERVRDTDAPSN